MQDKTKHIKIVEFGATYVGGSMVANVHDLISIYKNLSHSNLEVTNEATK